MFSTFLKNNVENCMISGNFAVHLISFRLLSGVFPNISLNYVVEKFILSAPSSRTLFLDSQRHHPIRSSTMSKSRQKCNAISMKFLLMSEAKLAEFQFKVSQNLIWI